METRPSPAPHAIVYGLITGGAMILFSLVMFLLDLHMNKVVGWLSYLFLLGGIVLSALMFKQKSPDGYLAFGQSFIANLLTGIFAGLLATIYFLLFVTLIHPGFINEMLDQIRAGMLESNSGMSEEQMDQAMKYTAMFMSPWVLAIFSVIYYTLFSAVVSLIVAAIVKKNPPPVQWTV